MEKDKIIFFRNFLFRTLIIGVLLAVILGVVTLAFWDSWVLLAGHVNLEETELRELTFSFFLNVRIILVFFFLAPALALHWMVKSKK